MLGSDTKFAWKCFESCVQRNLSKRPPEQSGHLSRVVTWAEWLPEQSGHLSNPAMSEGSRVDNTNRWATTSVTWPPVYWVMQSHPYQSKSIIYFSMLVKFFNGIYTSSTPQLPEVRFFAKKTYKYMAPLSQVPHHDSAPLFSNENLCNKAMQIFSVLAALVR